LAPTINEVAVYIGADSAVGTFRFDDDIAEVRLWDVGKAHDVGIVGR
jgi:hypothetical protein